MSKIKRLGCEVMRRQHSAVQVALEFVPTITTTPEVREIVAEAFAHEGIEAGDFERPAYQLDAEHKHPDRSVGKSNFACPPNIANARETFVQGRQRRSRVSAGDCAHKVARACRLGFMSMMLVARSDWRSSTMTMRSRYAKRFRSCLESSMRNRSGDGTDAGHVDSALTLTSVLQ